MVKNRKAIIKKQNGGKDMTINREKDIINPEMIKGPINYKEYFDIETMFIPAEIYIADHKMAW